MSPGVKSTNMISLTDSQFRIVMDAAKAFDPEWRDVFLVRAYATLKLRGRLADSDVLEVAKLTLTGLPLPEWIPSDALSDF
jgi:hypothetical protein